MIIDIRNNKTWSYMFDQKITERHSYVPMRKIRKMFQETEKVKHEKKKNKQTKTNNENI